MSRITDEEAKAMREKKYKRLADQVCERMTAEINIGPLRVVDVAIEEHEHDHAGGMPPASVMSVVIRCVENLEMQPEPGNLQGQGESK